MPILDWLDRDKDVQTADAVPYRLLEDMPELSFGDTDSPNMLIQGDNLEALKALLPYYAGQVKCIFIDPPYNTKSAFEHYDDNLEHSQWLSMMYPRLELLRELLSEDGSIWVTIDDNEAHYLKVVMDEVFGRKNFIVNAVWFRKVSPANDAQYFSNDHDHILVYSKNKELFSVNRLPREEKHDAVFSNPDNDHRGAWNSATLTGNKNKDERPNLYYQVTNPSTGENIFPPKNLTWRYSQDTLQQMVKDKLLYWGKDGTSKAPRVKKFQIDAKPIVPRSIWLYDDVGHTQEAMLESKKLFDVPFGTPKSERLLQRVLLIATKENDLVIDSFLGSGTTAAVAHKMNRRYIGIEMGEHAVTYCQPRLKKVVEGEQGGISEPLGWKGGGGFRFYQLGPTVFDPEGNINPKIRFNHLAAHIWFCETKTALYQNKKSPLLGVYQATGTAYYLLYNGVLGDKTVNGGNVLTMPLLKSLPKHDGPKVIYGETCRLSPEKLKSLNIFFKQTPYDVKAR